MGSVYGYSYPNASSLSHFHIIPLYSLTHSLLMDIEVIVIFVAITTKIAFVSIPSWPECIWASQWAKTQGVVRFSFSPQRASGALWSHPGSRQRTEPQAGATSASGPTAGVLALNPGALSLFSTEPAEGALAWTLRPPGCPQGAPRAG